MEARVKQAIVESTVEAKVNATVEALSVSGIFDEAQRFFDLGEYQKAIDNYNTVIRLDPQFAEAYYNRGVLYQIFGQGDKSESDKKRACELDITICDLID